MNELIFIVEESPEGGYTARGLGASIFTEADDVARLQEQLRDAVRCHFDEGQEPKMIRLHFAHHHPLRGTIQHAARVERRPTAMGKYVHIPGNSDDFAGAKQDEIAREDRHTIEP